MGNIGDSVCLTGYRHSECLAGPVNNHWTDHIFTQRQQAGQTNQQAAKPGEAGKEYGALRVGSCRQVGAD